MSKYFTHFPLKQYDYYGDGVLSAITDIYRMVAVDSIKVDDIVSYTYHEVKNGERPDVTSQILYGSPDYHWTFFVLNPHLRQGLGAWYKDDPVLEKYIGSKYDIEFAMEFKPVHTGPLIQNVNVTGTDEFGTPTVFSTDVTVQQLDNSLSGLDYSSITLGLSVIDGGYDGYIFPIAESDSNRNQLIFRKDAICKVKVIDGGSDYAVAPSIEIISEAGFGTGAKAEAVLTGSVITDVRMADVGYGYTYESYQVLVKNTPVEDARLLGTVSGGSVSLSLLPRPAIGNTSPANNNGSVYYSGKKYVKSPTVIVSPPGGGGTTAVFEVSVDPNTGELSSTITGGDTTLAYRTVTAGSGYADGERVYIRLVNEADSTDMLVAYTPPLELISSNTDGSNPHSLESSGQLMLVPMNPYLSTEAAYTEAQAVIDNWVNTIFYDWVVTYQRISYYDLWQAAIPSDIIIDPAIGISPYGIWSSVRYAPYTYYSANDSAMTVTEAQLLSSKPSYKTFADYEIELNDASRSIRIVRPENILQFTEEYRKVLNT